MSGLSGRGPRRCFGPGAGAGAGAGPGAPALGGRPALKLTAYFGERERVGGELVADRLFDLYAEAGLRTSVLLRGALGYGPKHGFRTDTLLTLSEDLPLASVAVDEPARIEAVLDGVVALRRAGLVTLERARLLDDGGVPRPSGAPGEETQLTIHVGRQERAAGRPAFVAICELLHRRGVAGATAFLGVDGTVGGERRRARFFARNREVPTMVIAVGAASRVAAVVPELEALLRRPLLTVERVRVCKRDGEAVAPLPAPDASAAEPQAAPPSPGASAAEPQVAPPAPGASAAAAAGAAAGPWQKLTVYSSEAARHGQQPIHAALVRRLRAAGIAGATSLRGIWGFHGDHAPHGDRPLALARRVPVATIVVDSPARIATAFAIADELTAERGLVTCETVPAMSALGERRGLSRHR